jgi:plasmid stabilization system protein ParE
MKRYTVNFTPRAERQLNALYMRIADDNGEARADNYVERIVADCLSLETFPERGTKRDDIRPNLRCDSPSSETTRHHHPRRRAGDWRCRTRSAHGVQLSLYSPCQCSSGALILKRRQRSRYSFTG